MLIFRRANHLYSLRRNLLLLVVVCAVPATLVSAALTFSLYELRREQVEQQTSMVARSVLSAFEREMATIESALKILASSQELTQGDVSAFYQRASDALAPGVAYNYLLTDATGQQRMNTRVPYGQPLPVAGTPESLGRVFAAKETVLTGIFMAPVAGKLGVAMGVPVMSGDTVTYSLNMGIDPARIARSTQTSALPDGWLVGILDQNGNIVTRTRDPERFAGQPAMQDVLVARQSGVEGNFLSQTKEGVPVYSAYANSKRWGWTVVVGAPRQTLVHALRIQLAWVLAGIVTTFGFGLWLARTISMRVLDSVHQLNRAAITAGQGGDITLPSLRLVETEAVLSTVIEAAKAMKQVKFLAQHDALTALPNRLLFNEVAERALALAERKSQPLALLALDLDGFKAVNDSLGHAAGDAVLQVVALRILQMLRASDIAARIGGDEFILLLSNVNEDQAMDSANRIIRALSESYPGVNVDVSASIGIALYPGSGTALNALAIAADSALYRAKNSGRRCAVVAS